jgi:predicted phosphodiesterase
MRYLIVSDIHANLAALDAVLKHAGQFDKIWCLGDVVGYGPNPNECIDRLRQYTHVSVAGNHDHAALGKLNLNDFNADAQSSTVWTQHELTPASRDYLENLPDRVVEAGFTLVHGSPREPIWEYIMFPSIAKPQFALFDTHVCFVGHTHTPVIFIYSKEDGRPEVCEATVLPAGEKLPIGPEREIINPGSVGQPRDGDPRAAYAVLDSDTGQLQHFRISYPITAVQSAMSDRDLPPRLIHRLAYGW